MCAHIAHHNKYYKTKLYHKVFNNYNFNINNHTLYLKYKRRANVNNWSFKISEKEFKIMTQINQCHICGRYSDKNHCNGVDRIDNNRGYDLDNCKSCCGDCNYMKNNIEHSDFLLHCALIAYNNKTRLELLLTKWNPSKFTQYNFYKKRLTLKQKAEKTKQKKLIRFEKTMLSKTNEAINKGMEVRRKKKIIEV